MKLKMQDLRLFNLVFVSDPSLILDFSNCTLSAFFDEELNIDIDDERYQAEGTSKAKRVRCLLKQVDRETALRVLDALWRYKTETLPEQAEQSRNDWLTLISRLENTDADTARGDRPFQVWHWSCPCRHIPGVSGLRHGLQNFSVSLSSPLVRHSVTRVSRLTAASG